MSLLSQVEDGNTSLELRQRGWRGREDIALRRCASDMPWWTQRGEGVQLGPPFQYRVVNQAFVLSLLEMGVDDPSCERARPGLVPVGLTFGLQLVYFLKEL
ncbi:hypothetical protein PS1_036471 [Malus domestica]